jgi:hypothetical protein
MIFLIVIILKNRRSFTIEKKLTPQIYNDYYKIYKRNNIGIILITLGVFLVCINENNLFKIGITIIMIGFFLICLKTREKMTNPFMEYLPLLIMVTWTIIVFFITFILNSRFDVIFILILIGLLILNQFISDSLPIILRNRLDFSILVLFLIFLLLIAIRIMTYGKSLGGL